MVLSSSTGPPFKQSNETLFLQMAETGGKGWAGAAVLSPSLRQEKALRLYRLLNGSPRDRVNNLGIEIRPQAQDRGLVRRIEAGQAKNSLFMLALHLPRSLNRVFRNILAGIDEGVMRLAHQHDVVDVVSFRHRQRVAASVTVLADCDDVGNVGEVCLFERQRILKQVVVQNWASLAHTRCRTFCLVDGKTCT
jgi:hypothetical protein